MFQGIIRKEPAANFVYQLEGSLLGVDGTLSASFDGLGDAYKHFPMIGLSYFALTF